MILKEKNLLNFLNLTKAQIFYSYYKLTKIKTLYYQFFRYLLRIKALYLQFFRQYIDNNQEILIKNIYHKKYTTDFRAQDNKLFQISDFYKNFNIFQI